MKHKFLWATVIVVLIIATGFMIRKYKSCRFSCYVPPFQILYQDDTRGRQSFPLTWDVKGQKLFVFSPTAYSWAAYDANGNRLWTGAASGGSDYCDDIKQPCRTPSGMYKVLDKKGADYKSSEYPVLDDGTKGGAPMMYAMHFYKGYAIHADHTVPRCNVSHGCVHVYQDAAKWLSEEFMDIGTNVLILDYYQAQGSPENQVCGAPITAPQVTAPQMTTPQVTAPQMTTPQ